ncbi:MAG: hypothetical protein F6K48_12105 [Okeania sp. SIO3H1]|nr:hypothetical protein [Okeania sp. SIO3H1]
MKEEERSQKEERKKEEGKSVWVLNPFLIRLGTLHATSVQGDNPPLTPPRRGIH